MSLWDDLFDDPGSALSQAPANEGLPVVHCCFRQLPAIAIETMTRKVAGFEPVLSGSHPQGRVGHADATQIFAAIRFGQHQIDLLGLASPLAPKLVEQVLAFSDWQTPDDDPLLAHRCYVTCYYHGIDPDPLEQYLALYKVIHAFCEQELLCVVNEAALLYHTAEPVIDLLRPISLSSARRKPPLALWSGIYTVAADNGSSWIMTRGLQLLGLPNFGILSRDGNVEAALELFVTVVAQLREKRMTLVDGTALELAPNHHVLLRTFTGVDLAQNPSGMMAVSSIDAATYRQISGQ